MCCSKRSGKENSGRSVLVHLNVYDLTSVNGYTHWLGLGVYHSGVEVHGVEYAFGAHEYPTTGIFEGDPKQCEGFTFRKSILIGRTEMDLTDVRAKMGELAEKYRGNAYNLITKNCNHFCNDVCLWLTGNSIPRWVNRLARIGFLCNCVLPERLNSTKVQHHRIEEIVYDAGDKKKLRSQLSRATSSSNSSSSFSSSVSATTLKSSRNRHSLLPPSPLLVNSHLPLKI